MDANIILSVPQAEFVNLEVPFPAYISGYGGGKSWAACAKLCRSAWEYPGVPLGYFAPTYGDIKHTFMPTIDECAAIWGLNTVMRRGDMEVDLYSGKTYRTTIICRSMRNSEAIRGFKIGRGICDELDTMSMENANDAWNKVIARRRYQFNGTAWVGTTSTPEGFRFVWDRWIKQVRDDVANDNKLGLYDKYKIIQASTYDNVEFLQPGYIEDLLATYPANLVRAYIFGRFVNLTEGSVYHDFNRVKNGSTEVIKPDDTLYIGMDFNVENMSGVVCVKRGDDIHVVDEIIGALDTPAIIRIIRERYWTKTNDNWQRDHNIRLYPDSSGGSRHTSDASTSDIQLLHNAGFTVVANKANPRVKDRVNSVNAAICNSRGERSLFVNCDRCPTVADNLEQQVYDSTGQPDKKSGTDHSNDGLGYVINMLKPLIRPATKINIGWAM